MEKRSTGKGVFFAVTAYVLWGVFPVYWKILSEINSFQILAFRILLSLFLAGLITTIPLYCFSRSAKILSLSAIGFLQFINPTLQLFLGIFVFGEPFPLRNLPAFILIWAAVLLYSWSFVNIKRTGN
ncbi:MAG: hypothetical protein LBT16_13455 [Treponema sp.]|jgi:EamA domain-containing membrane protein RarD|nr:hypothetical protein [Treponema sp.]